MTHTLSARFVEIEQPTVEAFECHGIAVTVDARIPQSKSFVSIVCTGSIEIDPGDELTDTVDEPRFVSLENPSDTDRPEVSQIWSRIEPVLQTVGSVLRWRFGMFGDDPLWTTTELILESDRDVAEFAPMPQAAFGDDKARIGPGELEQVAQLIEDSVAQPLAHEMWREAWNLKYASPRSGLVLGVAAAEVGLKQLVALLVPEAESLVEHIPSPPLDTMILKVLPDLPVRSGIPSDRLCPKQIRKSLSDAVSARNRVVHRGVMPEIHLWRTLMDIREFLYVLDWHAGHSWAESLLSDDVRAAIRRS